MKKVISAVLFIWFFSFQNALAQTTIHAQLGLGVAQTQDMGKILTTGEPIFGGQTNIGLYSKTEFGKFFIPAFVKFRYSTYSPDITDLQFPSVGPNQFDPYQESLVHSYSFLCIQPGIGVPLGEKLNVGLLVGYGLLVNQSPENSIFIFSEWHKKHNFSVTNRFQFQVRPKFGVFTELTHLTEVKETQGYRRSQTSYSLGIDIRFFTI